MRITPLPKRAHTIAPRRHPRAAGLWIELYMRWACETPTRAYGAQAWLRGLLARLIVASYRVGDSAERPAPYALPTDIAPRPSLPQILCGALHRFAFRTCRLKPLVADAILREQGLLRE